MRDTGLYSSDDEAVESHRVVTDGERGRKGGAAVCDDALPIWDNKLLQQDTVIGVVQLLPLVMSRGNNDSISCVILLEDKPSRSRLGLPDSLFLRHVAVADAPLSARLHHLHPLHRRCCFGEAKIKIP